MNIFSVLIKYCIKSQRISSAIIKRCGGRMLKAGSCSSMRVPFKEVLVCVQLLIIFLCVLLFVTSVEADYTFTVRFYEFRNPLGLQCGECGNGGPPACCDDVQRRENCNTTRPLTCDTRFRFMLRPFGAPVETAPDTGFPHYTRGEGDNSHTFNEGPGGFLVLPNPFIIAETGGWTGKTQFFIDALDRAVMNRNEIEVLINRFPIDLELNPGPNFTERTTYTGIYNISGLGFDMSFRVQCSENYYGADCNTFCEPVEGEYTCDSEGRVVCVQENHDPATHCMTCLQGWDLETNCTSCSPFYDDQFSCSQCLAGRDMDTSCTTCLSGYDPSTNCSQCLPGVECEVTQEPSQPSEVTEALTSPTSVGGSNRNLAVVGGAVGGAAGLLIIILLILCVIIVIMALQLKRQRKMTFPGAVVSADNPAFAHDPSVKERTETARLGEHDFENPLYDGTKQDNNSMSNNYADYSKLQRPPLQKPFVPPKFPYTTEHDEEASYQLDVAGKGIYDVTNDRNPPYDVAFPPPANENEGPYDVTHHPGSYVPEPSPSALAGGIYNLANYPEEQVVYDVADHPPQQESPTHSQNDYADIADVPDSTTAEPHHAYDYADIADTPGPSSAPHYDYPDTVPMSSPPPPPGHLSHDYDDAEVPRPSESTSMSTYYTNTTPGQVTPEALDHYDLGQ